MSTTYYFKNGVSIDMIKEMTDIVVEINEPDPKEPGLRQGSLSKGKNRLAIHVWDWDPGNDYIIGYVKRYIGNDPTDILFELRDKLGVQFLCEYVMAEYIYRMAKPPEAAWQDYTDQKTLDFGNPDSIYLPRDTKGNVIPYVGSERDNNHHKGSMPLIDSGDDGLPF